MPRDVTVRYEQYVNDSRRSRHTVRFDSLTQFSDWLFSLCAGSYCDGMYIKDPDTIMYDKSGRPCLDHSCISVRRSVHGCAFWIHQIETVDFQPDILYSDGFYTSGIKHICDEMKDFMKEMCNRRKNPTFRFRK